MKRLACLALLLISSFSLSAAQSSLQFQNGDIVTIMGNGLADRLQHDAWVEAVLQSQLVGKDVRFRNMAISGDTVFKRPRVKGFPKEGEFLQHVGADVVFAFFGYNESYNNQPTTYTKELSELVKELRGYGSSKKGELRVVLFSPIAFENTGSKHLPDGSKHNPRLEAYAKATEAAAKEVGATYVDLYTPTKALFDARKDNLTVNGCHLSEAGNRELALIIGKALFGKTVSTSAGTEKIRKAILDKNWHWHQRYRKPSGNDVWGTRSNNTYAGMKNATALQHELTMSDVLTANRDPAIWAAAAGKSHTIDDSNVPASLDVPTNLDPGSGQGPKGQKLADGYLSPAETAKSLVVPDGFEVNVFASEEQFPDLANPVQMQVDAKGRVWAASWNTYPMWTPLKEMNDSLMIFEDTNKDGVADKRTVFAEVHMPLGFEFWNGGVIVGTGTDILFLKDTNGDDVADERTILLQGNGTADTHHMANNYMFGPDGGLYFAAGVFLVNNWEHPWGPNYNITSKSFTLRFDPLTFAVHRHPTTGPNPHGIAFDHWGYGFFTNGTGGTTVQRVLGDDGFSGRGVYKKLFRPVAGTAILSSANLPDDMQGDFLAANVIGQLGLHQFGLNMDGDDKTERGHAKSEYKKMLVEGKDPNFRPSDVVFGEDGALYVADWHNQIIGHLQHNLRDPSRDTERGRIYRVVNTKKPLQKPVKIAGASITQLLDNLKHPVMGVRHRSRVELSKHDGDKVLAAAVTWSKNFNVNDETEAHHLLETLWLHQQNNARNDDLLNKLLGSKVGHAVEAAEVVQYMWDKMAPGSPPEGGSGTFDDWHKATTVKVPKHLGNKRLQKKFQQGAAIYFRESHCATCHQSEGEGMGTIYPALAGSEWVTGDQDRLIKVALNGLAGDPAKGVPPMTAFGTILNDAELAAVLTFIRNAWGNQAKEISDKRVGQIREQVKGQTGFWTREELLKK